MNVVRVLLVQFYDASRRLFALRSTTLWTSNYLRDIQHDQTVKPLPYSEP
jgi:hypothetical protein